MLWLPTRVVVFFLGLLSRLFASGRVKGSSSSLLLSLTKARLFPTWLLGITRPSIASAISGAAPALCWAITGLCGAEGTIVEEGVFLVGG